MTRAERTRLDNTIENALFKIDRYLERTDPRGAARARLPRWPRCGRAIRAGREKTERLRTQARCAELKLAQLTSLSPETFEEFVAELFEALGYTVEQTGGTGDEGADLRLRRKDLLAIVQCKYHKRSVVGSPELQKFLGTIHHTHSHKGFFVTTSTFSLAAEKFVADHPIELIDGSRLVELVQRGARAGRRREPQPAWFSALRLRRAPPATSRHDSCKLVDRVRRASTRLIGSRGRRPRKTFRDFELSSNIGAGKSVR